jgi:hypothetical protein
MKIEILICDNINEAKFHEQVCFNASNYDHNKIAELSRSFLGICIINGDIVKFLYSSLGNDGCIFSDNEMYRSIVKTVVPLHILHNYCKSPEKVV